MMTQEGKIAGFILDRHELEELFEENHYQLRRRTWRDAICDWQRMDVLVPVKQVQDKNCTSNWKIMFGHVSKEDHVRIYMVADKNDCRMYPAHPEGVTV